MSELEDAPGALTFLRTELETGLVLVEIAFTASDAEKINRNRENARRAYESARHFMSRISLSGEDSANLQGKLHELERRLRSLDGER